MLTRSCDSCGLTFSAFDGVYGPETFTAHNIPVMHCPRCGEEQTGLGAMRIDWSRFAKPHWVAIFVAVLVFLVVTLTFRVIHLFLPLMFAGFGSAVIVKASDSRHKKVGWFIVGFGVLIAFLIVLSYVV